ncbi:MAG TPA: hypothetical protein VHO48_12455 [Anaerolineaceae bacterium]|nr:hypothetical protein [Anaerolineaceae bacterium]
MEISRPFQTAFQLSHRLLRVFHSEGLAGVLKRIPTHLFEPPTNRYGYIIVYPLDRRVPLPKPGVDVEICELTLADQDLLAELTEMNEFHNTHAELVQRLNLGELCYVALHRGHIISYTWGSFQAYPVTFLSRTFPVGPDEVYLYDAYTLEAYRGEGINPYLNVLAGKRIGQKYNKRAIVGFMRVRNKSSMRSAQKRGLVRISTAGYLKLFGFRFHYYFKDRVL